MGTRRDDITSEQRAQIAITILAAGRTYGTVKQLTQSYAVSRQTIYKIAAKGEAVLRQGISQGLMDPTGPKKGSRSILIV